MPLRWSRLNNNAIASDAGHEIYRLPDGRFQAWSAPGGLGAVYGKRAEAALLREMEGLGMGSGNKLGADWGRARAPLGVFGSADEARSACDPT